MSLYFSLLPSDLSIDLLYYLDPATLIKFSDMLKRYPIIYIKLFPIDKLEILYRKYIASKLLDYTDKTRIQIITNYLDAYAQYKLLFYTATGYGTRIESVVKSKLDFIINNGWDIALITFMKYVQKSLENNESSFIYLINNAYKSAVAADNIDAIKFLYNVYDNFSNDVIIKAASLKKYDIFEYLLTLPEFINENHQTRAYIIETAARFSEYDSRIMNIIGKSISDDLRTTYNSILVLTMIMHKQSIVEIENLLDILQPEMNADPEIGIYLMRGALESSNLEAATLLLNYGVNVDDAAIIQSAIESQNSDVLRFIMRHGADPSYDINMTLDLLTSNTNNVDELSERFDILTQNSDIHVDNDLVYLKLVEYAPKLLLILLKREPTYTSADSDLLENIRYRIGALNRSKELHKIAEEKYNKRMADLRALEDYILSRTSPEESESEHSEGEESE